MVIGAFLFNLCPLKPCGVKASRISQMEQLSNTALFAKTELDILVQTVKDPIIKPFIPEIIALCDKFGKSGQSGSSAPYMATNYAIYFMEENEDKLANGKLLSTSLMDVIRKLLLQKPICEITGIDDEWIDVLGMCPDYNGPIMYQNKRCYPLFKNKDGSCWYLDAIAWKFGDNCMTGTAILPSGKEIGSPQGVKSFPFKPKTFYINVERRSRTSFIKNEADLIPVFKYYNRYDK